MAVTGFDFLTLPIKQHNYGPASMDKRSFDLNKCALDLNEVPSNELGLDLREASLSHELGSSLHPRRGGWFELFHNMFGHDEAIMDSVPFASCTSMLNYRYINHMPHVDKILQHTLPSPQRPQIGQRIHNGHVFGQNGDAVKDNVTESSNLAFMPEKYKKHHRPFAYEEFKHNTGIPAFAPLFNDAAMGGSHVRKPSVNESSVNESGNPGCAMNVFPPFISNAEGLKRKRESAPWGCNTKGPGHLSGSRSKFSQASVAPSSSHGFDQYKGSVSAWDLTSQPFPQWTADFQPTRHALASCTTSSGLFSQMQAMDKIMSWSSSAQVSEVASMKAIKDLGALIVYQGREKGRVCSLKKGTNRSNWEKAPGVAISEKDPSLSEGKQKAPNSRIRIIASPDWLPVGWITEVKTRMSGSTAGTTDKYYKDPETGRRFRSKNEVLNFIETGRLCKNKPQLKPMEGFAAISTLPLLLPRQDQSLCLLDNAQEVLARNACLTSQASVCQSFCSSNAILERPKITQEQKDMSPYSFQSASREVCRVSNNNGCVEGSGSCTMQEIVELEDNEAGKPCFFVGPRVSNACMHNEPVCKDKRKLAEDSVSLMSPKRFRSTIKNLQGGDKWFFCMEQMSKGSERQDFSRGSVSDLKIAHSSYPGLLNRHDPNGAQDKAVTDYLKARYKANLKALGLYDASMISNASEVNLGCMKDLQQRTTASVIKVVEKQSVKMILKQERDLLVSLGRRLCVEFFDSAKEHSAR